MLQFKSATIILIIFICTNNIFAQSTWQIYTEAEGLANNKVYSIVVDSDGIVWFGTYGGGISCYDGYTWKTYTKENGLADNYVRSLAIGSDGVIWCSTNFGVSKRDGETWITYSLPEGVAKHTATDETAKNYVRDIAICSEGIIWFGTAWEGVYRYDTAIDTWTTYSEVDGLAHNYILSVAIGKDGSLWCGTNYGISRYDNNTNQWTTYAEDNGLKDNWVRSIAICPDGDVLYGGKGISRYDSNTHIWKEIPHEREMNIALDYYGVSSLVVDPNGVIWAGTYGGGVANYDGEEWNNYTTAEGLVDNEVNALAMGCGGDLWVGTDYGVSRLIHPTGIEENTMIPSELTILGNFPNPFNPETCINFTLPQEGIVNLDIYNIMGQHVRLLKSDTMSAGFHSVIWDGRNEKGKIVSTGIYIAQLHMGLNFTTHSMTLVK